ncbi:MAG: hypothetical protein ACLPX7_23040 [Xanthobacteraceae bacterium]
MNGQTERKRYRAAFSESTETRLRDVFEAFDKLERELLQHIGQLRDAGWLGAENESASAVEPVEYADNDDTRYLLR